MLKDQLMQHEGFNRRPYKDSLGNLTIGYGRLLGSISHAEALYMLDNDIFTAKYAVNVDYPWAQEMDKARYEALINMMFNLGPFKLATFKRMLAALEAGNFQEAADEALDSRWAQQVGNRAEELARQFRTGEYA